MNVDKRVEKFKTKVLEKFFLEDYELEILNVTLMNLKNFYIASEQLKKDGITLTNKNGMTRKHPAFEIVKISWANFLSGLRTLKLQDALNDKQSKKVGRPLAGRV